MQLSKEQRYTIPFECLRLVDIDQVGGKNASLGEMISQLSNLGIRVPAGFATTAFAFQVFLQENKLSDPIAKRLENLNPENVIALTQCGADIRRWIKEATLPKLLELSIREEYDRLVKTSTVDFSVAVRSSATAEDLPDASFAGQQETYLNISGFEAVLDRVRDVFASLYNDRAIAYRAHMGFDHHKISLSAGIQKMVRSDLGSSGVLFTIDPESGFSDVVLVTSAYGLGETVVQGSVNPDEFYIHKPILEKGYYPIVRREIGSKLVKMEFLSAEQEKILGTSVRIVETTSEERSSYSLSDEEIIQLGRYACIIERHYGCAMDVEWGKDGKDNQLYILQARPETVKSRVANNPRQQSYRLKTSSDVLVTGLAIGQKVGSGPVRVIPNVNAMHEVLPGDVLVTDITDPDWEPIMKRASAIVTNRGGRTCHAAIIARELGIPAVVGCENATQKLLSGDLVTVSCAEGDTGYVYTGLLETEILEIELGDMPNIATKMMVNVGNPALAFGFSRFPNEGVGLARLEFIINHNIGLHPRAVLDYPKVQTDLKTAIESVVCGYATPRDFYVDRLAEGVATIAAAFWPKPVIVRLSDFKSNEYRKLVGGEYYEPHEENPMLGFRGAARYLSTSFQPCFELECLAIRKVRLLMGLKNVEIMIPFVRTVQEAASVVQLMKDFGLVRGEDGLRLIMMCELPSNALLADEFLEYFDGFSIGSNDLTQLTLGVDRDSGLMAQSFDERDPAVKALIQQAVVACQRHRKYVGICGQGPSDHPDLARWLSEIGITSLSLNPDTVISVWKALAEKSQDK